MDYATGGELNFVKRRADERRRRESRRESSASSYRPATIIDFSSLLPSLFVIPVSASSRREQVRPRTLLHLSMCGIYESVGANIFFRRAKGLGNERTHGEFSQERSARYAAEESRATSAHMAAPYVLSNGTRALHTGSSVPGDAYLTVNSSRL